MKKTSWLSLATAAAIVATSAGTFAAWDTMKAESAVKDFTLRNPVVTTVAPIGDFNVSSGLNSVPVATSTVTFTTTNLPVGDYYIDPVVNVYSDAGATMEISKGIASAEATKTAVNSGNAIVDITITPSDDADGKALVGSPIYVKVTGTLTAGTVTP